MCVKTIKNLYFYKAFFMNMKNMMFALIFGAAFSSSIAVAGVPRMDLEADEAVVALVTGSAGTAAAGLLGVQVGLAVGGPIGLVVGGAIGGAVGAAGGAKVGLRALVVTKSLYNKLTRSR